MIEFQFDALVAALPGGPVDLKPDSDLDIPPNPHPFVAPTLASNEVTVFNAEVLLVSAPAAVGKSTVANELSARRRLPRLDLARVPVGTGSLVGMISNDISSPSSSLEKFHQGQLTVIVDAPDEGRLLSGEASFGAFLETTWKLLLSNRAVTNRPKLIMFGRDETIDSEVVPSLQLAGEGIVWSKVDLAFFEEPRARELIDIYAKYSPHVTSAYLKNPRPVKAAVDAYFGAIAQALGLDRGQLWSAPEGRAFAGYAPVLSALGELLAREDNFKQLSNRLESAGARDAWDVIEDVALRILTREKERFCTPLATRLKPRCPHEAYDPHEQLSLVTQFVHGEPLTPGRRLPLSGADLAVYREMVQQRLPEHPFVRGRNFSNAVLGSMALAHAILHDLLKESRRDLVRSLSRQPFLWRSIRAKLEAPGLLDGTYLGCILNSLWSDPVTSETRVLVRTSANQEGLAYARIMETRDRTFSFETTTPAEFYSQMRNCDVDVVAEIICRGETLGGSGAAFSFRGDVRVLGDKMTLDASEVLVEASRLWLDAKELSVVRQPLRLQLSKDSQYGWAGQFLHEYPWNTYQSRLLPEPRAGDLLTSLVDECALRLPAGGTLTLQTDYSPPRDDRRLRWIERDFGSAFSNLVQLMVDMDIAQADKTSAHGPDPKVKVRFGLTWPLLADVVRGRPDSVKDEYLRARLLELAAKARARLGETKGGRGGQARV